MPANKLNSLLFPLLIVLFHVDSVRPSEDETAELFPQALPFFEKEMWSHHKSFSLINLITKNWVCRLPIKEKVILCVRVLENLKLHSLKMEGDAKLLKEEHNCVQRPVILESLPRKKLTVKMFRCPVKFSSKLSDNSYSVGSVDPSSPGFYITRGINSKSIFVLHDTVRYENVDTIPAEEGAGIVSKDGNENTVDEKGKDDHHHVERAADSNSDSSQEDYKDALDLSARGTSTSSQEDAIQPEDTSKIPATSAEPIDSASIEVKGGTVAKADGKVYMSNYLKIEKRKEGYQVVALPDFMKKLSR